MDGEHAELNIEENAPMVEGEVPAVEGAVLTDAEEDGMSSGEEETAAPGEPEQPDDRTYPVSFHANVHNKDGPNLVSRFARNVLRPFRDSALPVRQLLGLTKGARPAEVIQLVAHAKLNNGVMVNRSAMHGLAIVGTLAEDAQLKIARAAIAAASATQAKKKKLANALARVAKLEALETELTEHQKKSLALDKKKVEDYSKELAGK